VAEGQRTLYRGRVAFEVVHTFPFAAGAVMLVVFEQLDSFVFFKQKTAYEMIDLCQRMEQILRALYGPDGVNLGMNIGAAAGAGVAGHIHMHALPRWVADANFVSVIGETRVLPETLDVTWQRIRDAVAAGP